MSISENKRVVGLASVMGLAFAGLVYLGYSKKQELAATQQKIAELAEQAEEAAGAEVAPTKSNLDAVKKVKKDLSADLATMKKVLDKFSGVCAQSVEEDGAKGSQEFLKFLVSTISGVEATAKDKGVTVGGPAKDLGMSKFKTQAPTQNKVPFLHFQLKAVDRVVSHILDSGVASLDKVYCEELPRVVDDTKKKLPKQMDFSFQVAFQAKRGSLPEIINKIAADEDYLLKVTGISVLGRENPTPMSAYVEPSSAAEQMGEDPTADDAGAAPAASGRILATRLTGKDDEYAHVYLTLQVVYFAPEAAKSAKK